MKWILFVLISAIFLSLKVIFLKNILKKNSRSSVLFFISFFSMLFTIFFYSEINLLISMNIFLLIVLKSLIIGFSWLAIFFLYKKVEISTIAPLRNINVIFLVFFSYIFLNEEIGYINYIGIFLIILCSYFLELKSIHHFFDPLIFFKSKYFIILIMSAIGNAIAAILDKVILRSINKFTLMFYFYLFLSIIYFVILICEKQVKNIVLIKKRDILFIFLISVFAFVSDYTYFIAVALPNTYIVLISPLRRISNLLSTLIGGKLYKENNLIYKSIICVIMLIGAFLVLY